MQGFYRCAPCRGYAENAQSIWRPREMFIPLLLLRMEQGYTVACFRVNGLYLVKFVDVAQPTRRAEVVRLVGTTLRSWQDMIDGQWRA